MLLMFLLSSYIYSLQVFTASFGGPGGFRAQSMRNNMRNARREAPAENNQPRSIFLQLLPLFLLLGLSLLNALPNLFASTPIPDPQFKFEQKAGYNVQRTTQRLGVKYHVNAAEFSGHPIAAELARKKKDKEPSPQLQKFESTVERVYTQKLYTECQIGVDWKERRKNQEVGMFGIGTNWTKVREIEEEPVPSCDELRKLGLLK